MDGLYTNRNLLSDFVKNGISASIYGGTEVYIAVAFFTEPDVIQEMIGKNCHVRMIVRLGFPTNPYALRKLMNNHSVEMRFYTDRSFHPKLYIFGDKVAFVGSANLTRAAILTNQEVVVTISSDDERFSELAIVRSKFGVAERDQIEDALGEKIKSCEETQRQLDLVGLRIAELGLSKMDQIENDWLIKAIEEATSSLAGLEKEKSGEETIKATTEAEWNSSRSERMKIESNVNEWEKTLARLSVEIEEFRFRCKNLGLESDTRTDTIAAHQARFNQEKDKVVAVRKLADRYEWSFRINTLEKEQDELLQQLDIMILTSDEKQKQIAGLRNAVKEAESWISQLTESVKRAVEIQIAEHQPQILRLFKSMIPSPYLFQSVTMKHGWNGLELGLHYQGQEQSAGEPRFFLSCAQANVLALSIFLSLAGKQRWSKLDALFLDDPVQHLDDLNAVAFLDNLRAVSLGKFGPKRQIIVSTCDQNLYLLMIRKFRMLGAAGITFMGISLLDRGIEGPEIYYDVGGPRDHVTLASTA